MSAISCDYCGEWIEVTNRAFAGYCSAGCRDRARQQRHARRDGRMKRPKDTNDTRESS
jgi:hypothetical protein